MNITPGRVPRKLDFNQWPYSNNMSTGVGHGWHTMLICSIYERKTSLGSSELSVGLGSPDTDTHVGMEAGRSRWLR